MREHDPTKYLPWMCAGLVLTLEFVEKGAAMAAIVGVGSLAMFAFIVVALRAYISTDHQLAERSLPIIRPCTDRAGLEEAQAPSGPDLSTPRNPRFDIATDVTILCFRV